MGPAGAGRQRLMSREAASAKSWRVAAQPSGLPSGSGRRRSMARATRSAHRDWMKFDRIGIAGNLKAGFPRTNGEGAGRVLTRCSEWCWRKAYAGDEQGAGLDCGGKRYRGDRSDPGEQATVQVRGAEAPTTLLEGSRNFCGGCRKDTDTCCIGGLADALHPLLTRSPWRAEHGRDNRADREEQRASGP